MRNMPTEINHKTKNNKKKKAGKKREKKKLSGENVERCLPAGHEVDCGGALTPMWRPLICGGGMAFLIGHPCYPIFKDSLYFII